MSKSLTFSLIQRAPFTPPSLSPSPLARPVVAAAAAQTLAGAAVVSAPTEKVPVALVVVVE